MTDQRDEKLRHVVIGAGANVFDMHRPGLELDTVELVGINDSDHEAGQRRAEEIGVLFFADVATMLAETQPDVAVIITPHTTHAEYSIACLEAGCHVLVEKPIAIHVGEADDMIAAAQKSGRILAVNFQQRLRPEIVTARKLIQDGALGKIQNVDMKMTWTRTAIYYKQSIWRGTWAGEGGGVLMNQAPHELDLLCYLLGQPARVFAWTRTIEHAIETEDTIQAMLEWPGGAIGSVHISTAEAGQPQRFEIIGTGGHLSLGPGTIEFKRFEIDLRDFIATSERAFAAPELFPEEVELDEGAGNHTAIYCDLHRAIFEGIPVIADAASSSLGLELANAMTYSSYKNMTVDMPLDRAGYRALLDSLKAGSVTG